MHSIKLIFLTAISFNLFAADSAFDLPRENRSENAPVSANAYNEPLTEELIDFMGQMVIAYREKEASKEELNTISQIILDYLRRGADLNAANLENGSSAIHFAALSENKDLLIYLLQKKANVKAKTNKGSTALHFAATKKDQLGIAFLLLSGADASTADNDANIPEDFVAHTYYAHTFLRLASSDREQMLKELFKQHAALRHINDDVDHIIFPLLFKELSIDYKIVRDEKLSAANFFMNLLSLVHQDSGSLVCLPPEILPLIARMLLRLNGWPLSE